MVKSMASIVRLGIHIDNLPSILCASVFSSAEKEDEKYISHKIFMKIK